MAHEDQYTRALRFMGPILAEVLEEVARRKHCRVEDLATEEVSAYQDRILTGMRRALLAGNPAPQPVPPAPLQERVTVPPDVFTRPTVIPPRLKPPPAPVGALGPGQRRPTLPSHPPPPPGEPPFMDPHEKETPVRRRGGR